MGQVALPGRGGGEGVKIAHGSVTLTSSAPVEIDLGFLPRLLLVANGRSLESSGSSYPRSCAFISANVGDNLAVFGSWNSENYTRITITETGFQAEHNCNPMMEYGAQTLNWFAVV